MLPDAWRDTFLDMVTGVQPLDGTWFTGSPSLTPAEQIGVYANQYRLRLYDAVREEVPGLANLLGERAEEVLRAYIRDVPSTSWTLNDCADALEGWLEEHGHPVAWVEMARLDRAVQRGFTAADGTNPEPDELTTMPPLKLQPHVGLLRFTHNVHRVRSAALAGEPIPVLEAGDWSVVIFRSGLKMRHWEVPAGQWWLLKLVGEGNDVAEVLDRVVAEGIVTDAELGRCVTSWFRDFSERGLIEISRGSVESRGTSAPQ